MVLFLPLANGATSAFTGTWVIDREASTPIDPWSRIVLEISGQGSEITIERTVSAGRRSSSQVYPLRIGEAVKVPVDWWTGNRHIGAYIGGDGTETLQAQWLDGKSVLRIESHYLLATSQGESRVRSYFEYRLSPDGRELTVMELRSSRNRPIVHVFQRS